MRAFGALTSLLLSTALLLVGHGMQLTLLPLRAAALGQSDLLVAIGGSAYFAGFVLGCLLGPRIIARAGHIRSFAVLACTMLAALLALGMSSHWIAWLLLRVLIGVAICGLYAVIESWLNDQADASNRGAILSVYTFLVLVSMALGQQLVNAFPLESETPFMLLATIMAVAVIPVGMTRRLAPAPVEPTRASFRKLYRRSHTAFAGALLSGAVSGSFWALGALFAQRTFAELTEVTLFMSLAILGGALFQYPFGWLSDRIGRPQVIVLLCVLGSVSCTAAATAGGGSLLLLAVLAFGASTMPLYAMSLAAAADRCERHEFVEIGTSVLLLNGVGAMLTPLAFGQLMQLYGPAMLFWGSAGLCALTGCYALLRLRVADAADHPVPFSAAGSAAAPTSFEMDPRAEDGDGVIDFGDEHEHTCEGMEPPPAPEED